LLPRISAALAQFIAPVSASSPEARQGGSGFRRTQVKPQPQSQPEQQPPQENVIPLPKRAPETPRAPQSVSQAFIEMLASLQARRAIFMKWLGARSYQSAGKERRKFRRFRKGAMLDTKVE